MEEREYRAAYKEIVRVRCVFEKALSNNHACCSCADRFWLADREGFACKSSRASKACDELLVRLREKSRFVLGIQQTAGPLPHNREIRVQVGGLRGLRSLYEPGSSGRMSDVRALVRKVQQDPGGFDRLPFDEIMQSVARFSARKRKIRN